MGRRRSDEVHFWFRFQKPDGEEGCWFIVRRGEYIIDHAVNCLYRGRSIYVTRLAYELTYGLIPPGQLLRHRCGQGGCCNPDHLFLGTPKENGLDVVARRLFGARPGELCTYDDMLW